jgi:hypothetical protein
MITSPYPTTDGTELKDVQPVDIWWDVRRATSYPSTEGKPSVEVAQVKPERLADPMEVLRDLVWSVQNPICTGVGNHHINPVFMTAWCKARDLLIMAKLKTPSTVPGEKT